MGEQRFKVGDWVRVNDNRGAPLDYKVGELCQVNAVGDGLVFAGKKSGMFAARFEPWQPRVGERVKVTSAKLTHKSTLIGREFNVTHQAYILDDGAQTWGGDNAGGFVWRADELEPILNAGSQKPATLKIEAGKFYKTRDGRKVGPMAAWRMGGWASEGEFNTGLWLTDGQPKYSNASDSPALIAEWIDEPAAKVSTTASNDNTQPKFKVGDRVVVICNKTNGGDPIPQYAIGEIYPVTSIIKDMNGNDAVLLDNHFQYLKQGQFVLATTLTASITTIVALIEDGQPKPSSTPHVHASTGAAEAEAKRLAAKYKGKKFGVFTLTTTHEEVAPVYDHKWQNLAVLGLKIDAIKELRAVAGLDLLSAKRAVEAFDAAA